jgi:hypothetical protein
MCKQFRRLPAAWAASHEALPGTAWDWRRTSLCTWGRKRKSCTPCARNGEVTGQLPSSHKQGLGAHLCRWVPQPADDRGSVVHDALNGPSFDPSQNLPKHTKPTECLVSGSLETRANYHLWKPARRHRDLCVRRIQHHPYQANPPAYPARTSRLRLVSLSTIA